MEEYRRWEKNIKMDLKDVSVDVMSWLRIAIRDRPGLGFLHVLLLEQ
jgi:hypothetical protein